MLMMRSLDLQGDCIHCHTNIFFSSTEILTSVLQPCHTVVLMLLATILKVHTTVDAIKDFLETERNVEVKIWDVLMV